jgi:hypothetical protein
MHAVVTASKPFVAACMIVGLAPHCKLTTAHQSELYLGGGDINKIGELSASEPGRAASDDVHVHVRSDNDLLEVVLQDLQCTK